MLSPIVHTCTSKAYLLFWMEASPAWGRLTFLGLTALIQLGDMAVSTQYNRITQRN